jgi:acylphosphatase
LQKPAKPVAEDKVAKRYYVSGIVQGVGYRYFAVRAARHLGVTGFAKNLPDGRVEVYAIAPLATLKSFRAELKRGPQGASVREVAEDAADIESEFANQFFIEYDD